jgi:hypothetical protein
MNRTLLQEVKAMNKIAGTQMTKEQEIAFIKTRLNELEFTHQASFDAYKKTHKMRPDTKVKIAGKETTAGEASKEPGMLQKLGAKLFGKPEVPIEMPKLDPKSPINKLNVFDLKRGGYVTVANILKNPEKYKHLTAKVQSIVDTDPNGELAQKVIDKKSRQRKADIARKKERDQKQKEYLKWREDNPELAAKRDAEEERRRKREEEERKKRNRYRNNNDDDDYGSSFPSLPSFGGGSGGGFGGFGGGSFGGAGAGGSW